MKDPRELAFALATAIDQKTTLKESIDDIVLIGHSMGGLLVRQAFLFAMGDYAKIPRMTWATKVSRIVLLASLNPGLDPKNFRIALWDLFLRLWAPLRAFRFMLTQHLMRGSRFISDLRIRWMRNFALNDGYAPTMVQLLGSRIVDATLMFSNIVGPIASLSVLPGS
ncbi:MAG: alpha/beta fold hydrolase [Nitrospirales bacterium]